MAARNSARIRSYLDMRLPAGAEFSAPVAAGHNAFLYAYEGSAEIGAGRSRQARCRIARPASCPTVTACGSAPDVEGVRFLLLAAKPLREPVVQYGPFVMNTREEIEQALADYRDGRLAAA